jgi:predicted HicB family RNase H-like nuclease
LTGCEDGINKTPKEIKRQAARYAKFVEWSEKDRCFIGRCPSLFDGGVHGEDEAKVYADLCRVAEEWVELIYTDGARLPKPTGGKTYSGRFVIRVNPAAHRKLGLKAQASGDSLNSFCARVLSEA